MEPTSKLRLGRSTYNSGNPLSFSTIPDLKRKHYNFNMPSFGPDGKVRAAGGVSNKRYEDNNNKLKTVKFDIATGEQTDIPISRQRNHLQENESKTYTAKLGETYIHQETGKEYKIGNNQIGSGNMVKSSIILKNVSSSLKKSNLPSVGNKCALQNSSVIHINTNFNVKNIENLKNSINAGIGGKKSASRLYASNN